jgi:hypothetical protein
MTFNAVCVCGAKLDVGVNRPKDARLVIEAQDWEVIGRGKVTLEIAALCPTCKLATDKIREIQNGLVK